MLVALLLPIALAESPHPSGQIDSVVVYPDRAEITRVLSVQLQEGINHIAFHDLPPTVDERSIQAEGNGIEGAQLLGIDVITHELVQDRQTRVAEIEAKLAQIDDAIRADQDAIQAAKVELNFLISLQGAAAAQLSKELFFTDKAATQAIDIARLLQSRIPEVQQRQRQAEFSARDKQAQRDAYQRELATVRSTQQWSSREVNVDISAPKAGTAEIHLSYILPGAGWTAAYDVRALPDDKKVALVMNAQITQTSGEDWHNVHLSLSTARPAEGTQAPTLEPFWLQPPILYTAYPEAAGEGDIAYDARMDEDEQAKEAGIAPPPPPPPMAVATATLSERAIATSFEIGARADIPGDGTRRKVRVFEQKLDTDYIYVAAPRFSTNAYLVGNSTWNAAYPLLPGEVASFMGEAFVGTSTLGLVGTGSPVSFAFGVDDAIKISVSPTEIATSVPNLFGKITATRAWTFVATNNRKTPITLELRDRIPQSSTDQYKVKVFGDIPEESTEEGLITYRRTLAPASSTQISFGYQVRYPRKSPPGAVE